MRRAPAGLVVGLAVCSLPAQGLVKDIDPGIGTTSASSAPQGMVVVGGIAYFTADDGLHGRELWRTDGTNGAQLVVDLVPGSGAASPSMLTALGTQLLFAADDGLHGRELWISDGTAAGTRMLRDIAPGLESGLTGPPLQLFVHQGVAYFAATEPTTGTELWSTTGSTAGTALVRDIHAGPNGGGPHGFFALRGAVYFSADDGVAGTELWMTDGSGPGTQLVVDATPGPIGTNFDTLAPFGAGLIATERTPTNTSNLWISDGTSAGTQRILQLPGYAQQLLVAGSRSFFALNDRVTGPELWVSDGTAGGTGLLLDIQPGPVGSQPSPLAALGSKLLFAADDGSPVGRELWISDGTRAGTSLLKDLAPPPLGSSTPTQALVVGAKAYVRCPGTREVWTSDGTAAGTTRVDGLEVEIPSGVREWTAIGGRVVLAGFDASTGIEPWVTDGSQAGTRRIHDVRGPVPNSGRVTQMTAVGNQLYFLAAEPTTGRELWLSDGTGPGTRLVKDLRPGPEWSNADKLAALGKRLVFMVDDGVHGTELWTSDGTAPGTALVVDLTPGSGETRVLTPLVAAGGWIYFAIETAAANVELWRSDATSRGTLRVANLGVVAGLSLEPFGDRLCFAHRVVSSGLCECWITDGSAAGTTLLLAAPGNFAPQLLEDAGGRMYFMVGQQLVQQLWRTDGTVSGTAPVMPPTFPGFVGLAAAASAPWMDRLVFSAPPAFGNPRDMLWVTDGTATGTYPLLTGLLQTEDVLPTAFAVAGARIFFRGAHRQLGSELFASDGTPAGTQLVRDLAAGSRSGVSTQFGASFAAALGASTRLVFSGDDLVRGPELWQSDGTAQGTKLVVDLAPGAVGTAPRSFVRAGATMFWIADDPLAGAELFACDLRVVGGAIADRFGTGCGAVLGTFGAPVLGGAFGVTIAARKAGAALAWIVGGARVEQQVYGCTLYVGLPALVYGGVTDPVGKAALALSVPWDPGLLGLEVYVQSAVADAPLALSDGLRVLVGN